MSTTFTETDALAEDSITRRRQLKYVVSLADVVSFADLEGAEVYPVNDTLRSIAKITDGGIVFNQKQYMLPHTAAIACQAIYSAKHWKPVDGWKFWNVIRNGEAMTLESVRDELLDHRMRRGDVVADD
jgi:hypothetical protein